MTCERFALVKFRPATLAVIEGANAILDQYSEQGFTLTLRQLFYQFVARGLLPNTDGDYKRLGRTVADARRAGLIDWDRIEDRTRELVAFSSWESPAEILASAASSYREDIWRGQSFRVEAWIEKGALSGVIAPVCRRWRVPSKAARGYPSHSELYAAGKRMAAHIGAGLSPVVFYLGDHDPSGLDMTRSLETELSLYARAPVEVVRLALNLDQVSDLDLPPNPAKDTDRRFAEYVRETGCDESWELDALSPTFIDGLLERAIAERIDGGEWRDQLAFEEENRRRLERLAEDFGKDGGP